MAEIKETKKKLNYSQERQRSSVFYLEIGLWANYGLSSVGSVLDSVGGLFSCIFNL